MKDSWPVMLCLAGLLPAWLQAQAGDRTIANETLAVKWSPAPARIFISARISGREFLKDAKLSGNGGPARVTAVNDKTYGAGQAIEITDPNGNRDSVMLFPKLAKAFDSSAVRPRIIPSDRGRE